MAQLSPDTSIFDQVSVGLTEIISKKNQGKYIFKEEIISDFNALLNKAYRTIDSSSSTVDLLSVGEPPSSEKMNRFFSDLKNNVNISSKQLDYLLAKTINIFNLFNLEIENEKKYSKRIFSKTKILQMYSQSPAEDLVYIGDTFDNQDYVDLSKMSQSQNPLFDSGSMSVQITSSAKWNPARVKINSSNGVPGNNLLAVRKFDESTGETISHYYKDKASSLNINSAFDGNPLTYYEYEIFNVERAADASSELEFSYIVDSPIIKNAAQNSLFNWAKHDLKEPLKFDFVMSSSNESLANSIRITPYFGSSKTVKVSHVYVTDKQGKTEDILNQSIYIGSSIESFYSNTGFKYFVDSATLRFPTRNVLDIQIIMEQNDYEVVDILHSYWITDYSGSKNDNSPFFGSVKFNPDSLSRDIYQEVSYNKAEIVPPITNPTLFSRNEILRKEISVSLKKRAVGSSSESIETYKVPVKLEKDILKARRMSIGIRDVLVENVDLADSAEMISMPYYFDKPVESVMLSVESDSSVFSSSSSLISSYISVDDGKNWIKINPTQFGYNTNDSTQNPEIIVFNQNVPPGYKLPGVYYYNYPEVPQNINKILVRLNIQKDIINNMSPLIYSYMLAVKVSTT